MPDVLYPLDTTGLSPGNLILNEAHTLTEINSNTYNLIIPKFSPFYVDNFKLKHISDEGVISELQEGYHFNFVLTYLGGTRSIGKALYGGISIIDTLVNGYIEVDYQTLGGNWTADTQFVLTRLAEMVYNPRITVWDIVTNVQEIFPPVNHDNNMDYVYGHGDLISKLNDIVLAILTASSTSLPAIQQFIDNIKTDLTSLGLDQIVNLPLATDDEVNNKALVDKYITLRQLVNVILPITNISGIADQHLTNVTNPHSVTAAQVGLSDVSNLPLASDAEVANEALVDKYVTLKQAISLISQKIVDGGTSTPANFSRAKLAYLTNS